MKALSKIEHLVQVVYNKIFTTNFQLNKTTFWTLKGGQDVCYFFRRG